MYMFTCTPAGSGHHCNPCMSPHSCVSSTVVACEFALIHAGMMVNNQPPQVAKDRSAILAILTEWCKEQSPACRLPVMDLRAFDEYSNQRLQMAAHVHLTDDNLASELYRLPDKHEPFAIVLPSGSSLSQLPAFLLSRGWTAIAWYLQDCPDLWQVAKELNVWEGADVLKELLLQRYAFKPAPLLLQEIERIERLLAQQYISQPQQQVSSSTSTISRGTPKDGGTCKLRLVCLEPGCGSGRNIVWLAARSHSIHVTADCSLLRKQHGSRVSRNDAQHVQQQDQYVHPASSPAGGVTDVCESVHLSVPSGETMLSPPCKRQRQDTQHTEKSCQQPQNHAPESTAVRQHAITQQPTNSKQTGGEESQSNHAQLVEVDWEVIGVDNWYAALVRTQQLCQDTLLPPSKAQFWYGSISSDTGLLQQAPPPTSASKHYDKLQDNTHIPSPTPDHLPHDCNLLLCVRFLERAFLQHIPSLLLPGGFLLYCTFLDMEGTRKFGRPKGSQHLLQRHELASLFGPEQGFEILRDDVVLSREGRELSMFVARKLPVTEL